MLHSDPSLPDPALREMASMLARHHESDRGCLIFCAALVEDDLQHYLRTLCMRYDSSTVKKVIEPLFAGYAPLSTFSAKIQVSYAFGFISPEMYKYLTLLRKLRNDFAHEKLNVSFRSAKYQSRFIELIRSGQETTGSKVTGGFTKRLSSSRLSDLERALNLLKEMGVHGTEGKLSDRLALCFCVARIRGNFEARKRIYERGLRRSH